MPPQPPIEWTPELLAAFDAAALALGRLDSASTMLHSTPLFLYMYVRKEAVLLSMIEGTQSSLSDLLLYEIDQQPGVPLADVQEVSNCVADADKSAIARLGRAAASVHSVHAALLARPIASAGWIAKTAQCSMATVNKSLIHLEALNIEQRLHEGKRNRLFVYGEYMQILGESYNVIQ